jgi:hypothetical protein
MLSLGGGKESDPAPLLTGLLLFSCMKKEYEMDEMWLWVGLIKKNSICGKVSIEFTSTDPLVS